MLKIVLVRNSILQWHIRWLPKRCFLMFIQNLEVLDAICPKTSSVFWCNRHWHSTTEHEKVQILNVRYSARGNFLIKKIWQRLNKKNWSYITLVLCVFSNLLPVLTFHYYAIFCQLNAFSGPSINKTWHLRLCFSVLSLYQWFSTFWSSGSTQ